MKPDGETRVGPYLVQVVNAKFPTIVSFKGGAKGIRERGDFAFWTTVLKKRRGPKKGNRIWGRARLILPPGDRVDRMKKEMLYASDKNDRKIYRLWWTKVIEKGKNIKYIRPSSLPEVKKWMRSHQSDARYIFRIIVGGKIVK